MSRTRKGTRPPGWELWTNKHEKQEQKADYREPVEKILELITRQEVQSEWVPLGPSYVRKRERFLLCRCSCGTEKYVSRKSLQRGTSKSCGCKRGQAVSTSRRKLGTPRYSDGSGPARQTYRKLIRQAEERGYKVELSFDEYWQLAQQPCHYCGLPPSNVAKHSRGSIQVKVSGIDRWINSEGYKVGNCVPCCTDCNRAKSSLPVDVFYAWIARLKEVSA